MRLLAGFDGRVTRDTIVETMPGTEVLNHLQQPVTQTPRPEQA